MIYMEEDTTTVTPEAAAEVTPEAAAEVTPEAAAEVTPEAAAEVTPEAAAEVTPEAAAEVTPEEVATGTTAEEAAAAMQTIKDAMLVLEDFVKSESINPGLLASFKVEPANDRETPRSKEEWERDFDTQSRRVYR